MSSPDVKDTAVCDGNEGGAPPQTAFPVDSFREAAPHLRRPFTQQAVKFKVQATWPKDNPTGGLIVAYIDARLAIERLNLVVPHLWHDEYRAVGAKQMWCDLTVDGITRSDVGEGEGKGLVSDALKRAAVKFGIGVSLYAIPKMILNTRDDALKLTKQGKLELTPKGESVLRLMYAAWLDKQGTRAFGGPLDHGDSDDAQGDHEADGVTAAPASAPPPAVEVIGIDDAASLILNAESAGVDRDRLRKAVGHALTRDPGPLDDDNQAVNTLADLTAQQADRVGKWIEKQREKVAT